MTDDATQATLIDEYSHLWNDVVGRGEYLDGAAKQKHQILWDEVLERGGTAYLTDAENIVFHQLELLNMLESGGDLPGFFDGVTEQAIRKFTG